MAKVLVVDDDVATREFVGVLVEILGHECVKAGDGRHALEQARSFHPDLVITDVRMPRMDGYEFLRAMRDDASIAATRALVYTGAVDDDGARKALACGVLEVLVKPGRAGQLIGAIRTALEPHA